MEPADSLSDTEYKPDTLAARLSKGPIPAKQLCKYTYSIFKGIKAIHKAGFAHRDIKPDNILFVNGIPKLADMGLMSPLDKTMTSLAGTPGFIPPELRVKDDWNDCDHKQLQQCDLYAFGKVIYCMATGEDVKHFPSTPPDCLRKHEICLLANLACLLCENDPLMRVNLLPDIEKELIHISAKISEKDTATSTSSSSENVAAFKLSHIQILRQYLQNCKSHTQNIQKKDLPIFALRIKNFLKSIGAGFLSLYKWVCKYKAATIIFLAVIILGVIASVRSCHQQVFPPVQNVYQLNSNSIKLIHPATWDIYSSFNTEEDQQEVQQFLKSISTPCKDGKLNFIVSYVYENAVNDNIIVCKEGNKIIGYILIQMPYPLAPYYGFGKKFPYDLPHITQWLYDYNQTNPPDFKLQEYTEIKINAIPCLKVFFTRKSGEEFSLCYIFQNKRQCFSIILTAYEQEFHKLQDDFERMINAIEIK